MRTPPCLAPCTTLLQFFFLAGSPTSERVSSDPPDRVPEPVIRPRRTSANPLMLGIAALAVVAVLAAGAMTLGGSGDPPEQAATVSRVETVAEKPRADPPSTAQRLRSTPPVATTRTGVVVDTWRDPDEPCLNLRRAANHSSARITCMEDGTELIIHGKTGDWYSVTMPMSHGDGPKGYAHGKWIREN